MAARVNNTAKIVGCVIVRHWSEKYDRARLKLETIMAEAGCSRITVIRSINALIHAQIFVRVRTGRASILRLGEAGKNKGSRADSGSINLDTSKPRKRLPTPRTGTRFLEFCPADEREESAAEMAVKDAQFYLGF